MAAKSVWNICFFSVCFSLNFVTTSVLKNRKLFPLDIIHYNDFHDRFEETTVQFPICMTNDTNCIGGFPRLYQEIKTLQKQKPDALILNAGDAFQGTYWYTLLKWNVTQHFLNLIPHDAHTLGNHEFDNGIEGLAPYLAALRAPVVVANIDTSEEPLLNDLYKPHLILERNGRKIGIIGVITPETKISSRTGKVIFSDPITVVKEQSKLLTDQGVDIIIVLSHCGIKVDMKMAKEAGSNVDIIVGGHSHSLLWNDTTAPSKEEIVGPYPVILESESRKGHKVLVVTASAFSKYLGNMTVYFDGEGELISFDGGPIFLDRSIPEDPDIKAQMAPYTEYLHKMVLEIVGKSDTDLPDNSCGARECILGDVIADAMLNATNELSKSKHQSVSFFLRNMIRGGISKGDISRGSIINTLPFSNKVVSINIKGKYLLEALNKCMSVFWRQDPFTGPWMPQVAGMEVVVDTKQQKVLSVKIGEKLEPLMLDQFYRLTTVDFLADGGSDFTMLKENSQDYTIIGLDAEIVEKYVKLISPISSLVLDNRLVVVNKEI